MFVLNNIKVMVNNMYVNIVYLEMNIIDVLSSIKSCRCSRAISNRDDSRYGERRATRESRKPVNGPTD